MWATEFTSMFGRLDQPVVLEMIHCECCYFLSFLTYFHFSLGFLDGKPTMNEFLRTIKRHTECKTTEYRVIIFSLEMVSKPSGVFCLARLNGNGNLYPLM